MVKSLYVDFMVQSLAHIADQGATDDQRQEQLLAWARVALKGQSREQIDELLRAFDSADTACLTGEINRLRG